ncbi:MAG: KAP family NTPase [Endomicrobia bacterium]|nr:KAP family NTPase [Endomicrobiia bacterium]MCL2506495.1 KAP family NTPase [Endomicrobiia bacterium]
MTNEIKFINFEPSETDKIKSETHENIANSVMEVLTKTKKGLTIGLEGEWGSGKSTVIEILNNKINEYNENKDIEDDKKVFIFKFDTWVHEEDKLRRIFLEQLIIKLEEDQTIQLTENEKKLLRNIEDQRKKETLYKDFEYKQLKNKEKHKNNEVFVTIDRPNLKDGVITPKETSLSELKRIISGKQKEDLTITKNRYSGLLKILAFVFIFAPIFATDERYLQYIGIVILVFIGWAIYLLTKEKDVFDGNNWTFKEDENKIENNLCLTDNECSSVEFEYYFSKILEKINKKNLIVIDNLDRIDSDIALKMWSTLQVFLQNEKIKEKTYVIVPFDSNGLKKLWDNADCENSESKDCSKSFMDKCFQIIVDVPKPITSDISLYAKNRAEEIFDDKDTIDKILSILRNTTNFDEEKITPRIINNYLNSIQMLILQYNEYNISIPAIAYYSLLKNIKDKSLKDIRTMLINRSLLNPSVIYLFENFKDTVSEFASLVFIVSKEKGLEILVEEQIKHALNSNDHSSLHTIYNDYKDSFAHYLSKSIAGITNFDTVFIYSFTIRHALYNDDAPEELKNILKGQDCVKQLPKIFQDKSRKLEFPKEEQDIKKYISFVELVKGNILAIDDFHFHFIKSIESVLNKENSFLPLHIGWIAKHIILVMDIYKPQPSRSLEAKHFSDLLIENDEVTKYILPRDDQEVYNNVLITQTFPNKKVLDYIINKWSNIKKFKELLRISLKDYLRYAKANDTVHMEYKMYVIEKLSQKENFNYIMNEVIEELILSNKEYIYSLELKKIISKYGIDIKLPSF